ENRSSASSAMHVLDSFAVRQVGYPISEAHAVDLQSVEIAKRRDAMAAAGGDVRAEVGRARVDFAQAGVQHAFEGWRRSGAGACPEVSLLHGIVLRRVLREDVVGVEAGYAFVELGHREMPGGLRGEGRYPGREVAM